MRDVSHLLRISEDDGEIIYLGYSLNLTVTERRLLLFLIESRDGMSSRELCSSLGLYPETSRNAVSVHVYNINNKAKRIGGRRLITDAVTDNYRINEYL